MIPLNGTGTVAYFSMEIALDPAMPTYSGGLGVLAGDTLRAAADLGLQMVAVTLVHRRGYVRQHLDASGSQGEEAQPWSPEATLERVEAQASVTVEGRTVHVGAWRYQVHGARGSVPVFLLDTDLPENGADDRRLTDELYGGDERYRLAQEIVLGVGGVALLEALGRTIEVYHMNEGHSALLTLALLRRASAAEVRERCVFTTHTPVAAGHDRFPLALAGAVLGDELGLSFLNRAPAEGGALDMTHLAVAMSRFVNAVSRRHAEVTRTEYQGREITAITNGVHAATWAGAAIAALLDRYVPGWRADNVLLHYAGAVPLAELAAAHAEQKALLHGEIRRRSGVELDPAALTLVFARRATAYKRAALLLGDPDRLRAVVHTGGPLQLVFAGKAHRRDAEGKAGIAQIVASAAALAKDVRIVYLEDYGMALAKLLVAGADVWLNTPRKPFEASGTSGMKAAINGVPNLSVPDGWWPEGHVEGVTGWGIGGADDPSDDRAEAAALYDLLERVVLPLFHRSPERFSEVRRSALALCGSFFNTHRMVREYASRAYFPPAGGSAGQPPKARATA